MSQSKPTRNSTQPDEQHAPIAYRMDAATEVSGLSRSNLFLLIKEGRLKSARVGRHRLVLADSLRQFLNDHAL